MLLITKPQKAIYQLLILVIITLWATYTTRIYPATKPLHPHYLPHLHLPLLQLTFSPSRQRRIDIPVKLNTLLILFFYNRLHLKKKNKRHVTFSILGFGKETISHMKFTLQFTSVQIQLSQTFHYLSSQLLSLIDRIQSKHPTPMAIILSPSIHWGFRVIEKLNLSVIYLILTQKLLGHVVASGYSVSDHAKEPPEKFQWRLLQKFACFDNG